MNGIEILFRMPSLVTVAPTRRHEHATPCAISNPGHKAQGSGYRRTRLTAVLSSHWLQKIAKPLVDDVEGTPTILEHGDT